MVAWSLSLLLLAASLSPASASPVALDLSLPNLAPRTPDAVPDLGRRETRQEAADRVQLAKSRAARKVRTQPRALPEPSCFPQGVTVAPAHGTFRISSQGCKLVCSHSQGYRPSADGLTCKLAQPQTLCGDGLVKVNDAIVGTHVLRNGVCKLVCYASSGYKLSQGTCIRAFDITSDATHCGPSRLVCHRGYPHGEAACVSGECTVRCPSGQSPTGVPGTPFFTCI